MAIRCGVVRRLFFLLAVWVSFAHAADQQCLVQVSDITGAVIQRATVELRSSKGDALASTVTDAPVKQP